MQLSAGSFVLEACLSTYPVISSSVSHLSKSTPWCLSCAGHQPLVPCPRAGISPCLSGDFSSEGRRQACEEPRTEMCLRTCDMTKSDTVHRRHHFSPGEPLPRCSTGVPCTPRNELSNVPLSGAVTLLLPGWKSLSTYCLLLPFLSPRLRRVWNEWFWRRAGW